MTNGPIALGSPIVFKGKWLGGTGKFDGLTGDIEIRPTPILATETLVQGVGKKTGHIALPNHRRSKSRNKNGPAYCGAKSKGCG